MFFFKRFFFSIYECLGIVFNNKWRIVCLRSLLREKNAKEREREREDFCIMIITVSIHRSSLLFVLYSSSVYKRQKRNREKGEKKIEQSSHRLVVSTNKEPVYLIKSIIATWKLMAWHSFILMLSEQQRNKWKIRTTIRNHGYCFTCLCMRVCVRSDLIASILCLSFFYNCSQVFGRCRQSQRYHLPRNKNARMIL